MEQLSRFIRSRGHYSPENNRVKHSALLPMFNDQTQRYETSVFYTDNLTENEIWQLGKTHIDNPAVKARGDFNDAVATGNNLQVDFNNTPARHADIINWPDKKDEQKLVALKIAPKCSLKIMPADPAF
jgi:hypothetical protein